MFAPMFVRRNVCTRRTPHTVVSALFLHASVQYSGVPFAMERIENCVMTIGSSERQGHSGSDIAGPAI